jgi:hypothetical protein
MSCLPGVVLLFITSKTKVSGVPEWAKPVLFGRALVQIVPVSGVRLRTSSCQSKHCQSWEVRLLLVAHSASFWIVVRHYYRLKKQQKTEVSASNGENTPWGTAPRSSENERKLFMRSDLIYGALAHISNRYQLCQLASKATRKLHKPNTRLQDTTNEVLVKFHQKSPMAAGSQVIAAPEQVSQQRRAA